MKNQKNKAPSVSPFSAKPNSLEELQALCREHGITNTVEYRNKYKSIPGLPAHPERLFKDDWQSYKSFFEIPEVISYQELKSQVQAEGIQSKKEYIHWINKLKRPEYPRAPESTYVTEWEGWFDFCGKEKPFKPEFIPSEYSVWAKKIEEFMKVAYGGSTKVNLLCRFVRMFVEKYDKSKSPQELLTKKRVVVKPFRYELNKLDTDNHRRRVITAVNEFLNYVINNDLTDEDEETGEVVRVLDARNPFELFAKEQSVKSPTRNESTKPCLQYYFVRKAQEWIIPAEARTFSDLQHLQKFDTDWIKVSKSVIDESDPDCVFRIQGKQYFLWCPTDWIHTFALTKVPLRGRQIAYNDSGEADAEVPEIGKNQKVVWVKNDSPVAGMTKKQSFIKKFPDGNIGMYVTTNKTSISGSGYSIPWVPEDLAYWLIKLRKWQQKYNPISEPTPWSRCLRTNLNDLQRKAMGVNSFLFREFGGVEPKNPSSALTMRLAATLYNIQPSSLKLAELDGSHLRLSNYTSKYTPHSMRVSLITAYVMEMGMPVEIVMKVVGHSSIVMSIYYCKISHGDIREKLEKAEKVALKNQAQATQTAIEQNNIESVKNTLIGNNEDLLRTLDNSVPAGNYIFRDYGICPFAATRCDDGGEALGTSSFHAPAPSGYLGVQNCLRCRHFLTGPAFIGGLISVTNEILLEANFQSEICENLQGQIAELNEKIAELDREEYLANLKQLDFDSCSRKPLEFKIRKLESEYESAAKKMDMLLCDLQSAYRLIQMSQKLANGTSNSSDDGLSLVKRRDSEVQIELEESSYFHQLHEICENAEIYESSNPSRAITPRSQQLDRMAALNKLAPSLFMLTEKQQLSAGNQLVELLRSRLKEWSKVEKVVDGRIKLSDLIGEERIEQSEIEVIMKQSLPMVK